MRLDRNSTAGKRGKYALLMMREWPHGHSVKCQEAFKVLEKAGAIDFGGTEETEFFFAPVTTKPEPEKEFNLLRIYKSTGNFFVAVCELIDHATGETRSLVEFGHDEEDGWAGGFFCVSDDPQESQETTTTKTERTTVSKKARAGVKQQELDVKGKGVELLVIEAIDKAIAKFERKKEKFIAENPGMQDARKEAQAAMHEHRAELPVNADGNPFYRYDGRDYILTEKLKIEKIEEADALDAV